MIAAPRTMYEAANFVTAIICKMFDSKTLRMMLRSISSILSAKLSENQQRSSWMMICTDICLEALLTRTSRPANLIMCESISLRQSSSFCRSTSTRLTSHPSLAIWSAARLASSFSCGRYEMVTPLSPSMAKSCAAARPIPLSPPVTMAYLPFNLVPV